MREAFRQVLHGLPCSSHWASLIAEELQAKLHPEAALEFRCGFESRRYHRQRPAPLGSLVTGGLTPKSAAEIVGFDDIEVSAPMSFYAYEIIQAARSSSRYGCRRTDRACRRRG